MLNQIARKARDFLQRFKYEFTVNVNINNYTENRVAVSQFSNPRGDLDLLVEISEKPSLVVDGMRLELRPRSGR